MNQCKECGVKIEDSSKELCILHGIEKEISEFCNK